MPDLGFVPREPRPDLLDSDYLRDLKDQVGPMLQWYGGGEQLSRFLAVRLTNASNAPALIRSLEAHFNKMPARRSLSYTYLADEVAKAYEPINNAWRIVSFVTMIAVLTACAGIFGLITLVARRRTKEIGIRKVLGASVPSVALGLSSNFLKLVGLAILIAAPASWWLGQKMLGFWACYIEPQWWYLVVAALLAVGIAFVSVVFQALKAALENPVKSLRSE